METAPNTSPQSELSQSFRTAWSLLPRLLRDPVGSVDAVCKEFDERKLMYVSSAISFTLSFAIVFIIYFRFHDFTQHIDSKLTSVIKAILVLEVPFVSLAVANYLFQRVLGGAATARLGGEMLAAAVALLPSYAGFTVCSLLGSKDAKLIVLISSYGVILTTLFTYALSRHRLPAREKLVLLLTPLKIMFAGFLTKVMLDELF